jgi:dTDP-4-dehydrorhamnose 3,5-epimerase
MDFEETPIPGAFLIRPTVVQDDRGNFVKVFHQPTFRDRGLEFQAEENYYSTSRRGVIRGMHFQTPPAAHEKLVYCIGGRVLDVILDLRKGSPATNQFFSTELSGENRHTLFLPAGVAHGFLALDEQSIVVYAVTAAHHPRCDAGIRWDSFGMQWPVTQPIVSPRDAALPPLREFVTPFVHRQ